jgi:hypothetical protein
VPREEDQVFDLMAITDELRARGFDIDDELVEAVIVGETSEVDPDLVSAIHQAAGIAGQDEVDDRYHKALKQ